MLVVIQGRVCFRMFYSATWFHNQRARNSNHEYPNDPFQNIHSNNYIRMAKARLGIIENKRYGTVTTRENQQSENGIRTKQ